MCVHLSFPSALSPVCGSGPTSSFVSPVCLRGRPATGRTTRGARTLGPVELFRRPASARCCTVLHNTELFPTLVLYPFGKGLSRPGYALSESIISGHEAGQCRQLGASEMPRCAGVPGLHQLVQHRRVLAGGGKIGERSQGGVALPGGTVKGGFRMFAQKDEKSPVRRDRTCVFDEQRS